MGGCNGWCILASAISNDWFRAATPATADTPLSIMLRSFVDGNGDATGKGDRVPNAISSTTELLLPMGDDDEDEAGDTGSSSGKFSLTSAAIAMQLEVSSSSSSSTTVAGDDDEDEEDVAQQSGSNISNSA